MYVYIPGFYIDFFIQQVILGQVKNWAVSEMFMLNVCCLSITIPVSFQQVPLQMENANKLIKG